MCVCLCVFEPLVLGRALGCQKEFPFKVILLARLTAQSLLVSLRGCSVNYTTQHVGVGQEKKHTNKSDVLYLSQWSRQFYPNGGGVEFLK